MERTSRINLYLNTLVLLKDLGWKAAVCSSSSAIKYFFSGCLQLGDRCFGAEILLIFFRRIFLDFFFLFESNTMSHFLIDNSVYEVKGFAFRTFVLTT